MIALFAEAPALPLHTAGPYVAGVPIGRVTHVYSSVRETSQRAVLDPFVDFGSLDLVGVIVPTGTVSDRGVIQANGSVTPASSRRSTHAFAHIVGRPATSMAPIPPASSSRRLGTRSCGRSDRPKWNGVSILAAGRTV